MGRDGRERGVGRPRALGREGLLHVIEASRGRIVEVHVHGALHRSTGMVDHLPLRMNNVVDFASAMPKIVETGFRGPFIFEITSSEELSAVITDCRESKELLLAYLGGG